MCHFADFSDLYSQETEVVSNTHTYWRLYFKTLWVTVEAVILVFMKETVGRNLDVLTIFILHFYLQKYKNIFLGVLRLDVNLFWMYSMRTLQQLKKKQIINYSKLWCKRGIYLLQRYIAR